MHHRRRQRAAILEAIRNGTYVPPDPEDPTAGAGRGRLGAVLLGEKPKMFEVAIVDEKWRMQEEAIREETEDDVEAPMKGWQAKWGDITVRIHRLFSNTRLMRGGIASRSLPKSSNRPYRRRNHHIPPG